jgi:ABC-type glycerol-3-phosphate transport system substrate-binding protein
MRETWPVHGWPMRALILVASALFLIEAGCSTSKNRDSSERRTTEPITVWILENQPERVRATHADVADFTRRSGVKVKLVVVGDGELPAMVDRAKRSGTLPDVAQLGMASAHSYLREGILNAEAVHDIVQALGEDTFSARALSLVTSEGRLAAVPSDGWGQLLIYRKDLFNKAGLSAPRTPEDVESAAKRLQRAGLAGITLATSDDSFTAETFEHVALAFGCQLVDGAENVTLTSPACRRAFAYYVRLARKYSLKGPQDVDTTRDAYFAGRAAMILWSPFLLDAMAGLRNEALPSCPECKNDPAYLARHSGLVGPLERRDGSPAQYGNVSTWGIFDGASLDSAKSFVKYMMSEGYMRWLALSPQGKYPVRFGDHADPERYVTAWRGLLSGVERKAPLRRFYSEASVRSLGAGVQSFQRWGFEQGEAALVGALEGPRPIPKALSAAIAGRIEPNRVAAQAQMEVEKLKASLE